jgi:hypothetical protein
MFNCKEERLLGVSLTGICDNKIARSPEILRNLKTRALETNSKIAHMLGINPSKAITTVKPSGTVSLLVGTSSGIHPRFSQYYLRRIRMHYLDPLAMKLKKAGLAMETDKFNDTISIVTIPIKAPENSIFASQMLALDQLELWKILKTNYCEHNPSMTCYVRKNEWALVKD